MQKNIINTGSPTMIWLGHAISQKSQPILKNVQLKTINHFYYREKTLREKKSVRQVAIEY